MNHIAKHEDSLLPSRPTCVGGGVVLGVAGMLILPALLHTLFLAAIIMLVVVGAFAVVKALA